MPCILPGQPTNTNPLQVTGYRFTITRLPNVVYFLQSANLPGIIFGNISWPTPMSSFIEIPGDTVKFAPFTMKFVIDENLSDWLEIFNWVQALARVKELNLDPVNGQTATVSDGTLYLLTSNKNVNVKVTFRDMFPIALSGIDFDSAVTDLPAVLGTVTFAYSYYDVEVVGAVSVPTLPEDCAVALPP